MSTDRLPPHDPSRGLLSRRGSQWVETWNLRNGVAWRDPLLAERAVAAWHERRGLELRDSEATTPVLVRAPVRRIGVARQAAARAWGKEAGELTVATEALIEPRGAYLKPLPADRPALQRVGS